MKREQKVQKTSKKLDSEVLNVESYTLLERSCQIKWSVY